MNRRTFLKPALAAVFMASAVAMERVFGEGPNSLGMFDDNATTALGDAVREWSHHFDNHGVLTVEMWNEALANMGYIQK